MTATLKIISAFIAFSAASSSTSFAENCKALPFGPEKHARVMREHPEMFEAKQERCRQLARERGLTSQKGTGTGGTKDFVHECMRGKQQ
jgi:phage antirepressor YoqD-like protein